MSDPYIPDYILIYKSNFTNSNDGWFLINNNANTKSTYKISDGKIVITVAEPGSANWHIQFIKQGMGIEKGKTYRLSFRAHSPNNDSRSIYVDISRDSDPWTAYGSRKIELDKTEKEYNLIFTSNVTDIKSRIVFSVGGAGKNDVILSDINFMEVVY